MPHLLYIAVGFPPAAKSCAYRMLATANTFVEQGWDVTVITLRKDAWLREYGLDDSLTAQVHPSIKIVEVPLARKDLDPDVRRYPWRRVRYPIAWLRWRRRLDQLSFPEPIFGSWRRLLSGAAIAAHTQQPVDLTVVSPAPYTTLAAAWKLYKSEKVPFIIDFRDAWSLNVISGETAFPLKSRRGRWEARLFANAFQIWCVNNPIANYYRDRYPAQRSRIHVLRNGYDEEFPIVERSISEGQELTFGYLGTVTYSLPQLRSLLDGWAAARKETSSGLASARLEFRGHMGAGIAKAANAHARLIKARGSDDVSYGGPVGRDEIQQVFASWDVMLLILTGGGYVTSGKVYEYMATGLPILSIHSKDHAAVEVLRDYPLWVQVESTSSADVAAAFIEAAHMARSATTAVRQQAQDYARQFARNQQLTPRISELSGDLMKGRN